MNIKSTFHLVWNICLCFYGATKWVWMTHWRCLFRLLHVWCWTHCWLLKSLLWHLCWNRGQWSCPGWCAEWQPLCQDLNCWNFRQCHWTIWSDRSHLAGKCFFCFVFFSLKLLWMFLLLQYFNISCCGHGSLNKT